MEVFGTAAATYAPMLPITDLASLRRRGAAAALVSGDGAISYAELVDRIEARIGQFGAGRRLIALDGGNDIEFVVSYLAALCGGHVVAVGPADSADRYRPDTIAIGSDIERRCDAHVERDLHRDLVALMSTSGSTGSQKMVRLSRRNIDANAAAIAAVLQLRPDDVAITSLPLHYCYGLSIVTSHLAVGASVVLTDTSVVDPCFWKLVDRWNVTTLSGVPHSFDLIERLDEAVLARPALRRVTQAGGRLAPDSVRHFADVGQRYGWDFTVMYGQTEATARMAALPADRAVANPTTVGVPIPGGSFRFEPLPADEVRPEWAADAAAGTLGEIVYSGPNVMLGYAETVADLCRGRDIDELHTGDIGRRTSNGLYEVVGRRARFLKLFGRRIDLAEVERRLDDIGVEAAATGDDQRLVVGVVGGPAQTRLVRHLLDDLLALPDAAVAVVECTDLPRTASGKVDRCALLVDLTSPDRVSAARHCCTTDEPQHFGGGLSASIGEMFASVLGRPGFDRSDSFTSLGGDSLSYVEASIRLDDMVVDVPAGWHLLPIRQLDALPRVVARSPRRLSSSQRIETSVVLRAVGILVIVATHMGVARLAGGAHTLLAVVGYNFARFQLTSVEVSGRLRRGLTTVASVAVPTSLWVGIQMLLVGGYSAGSLFLVNNYFGSAWRRDGRWEYWYFEAFVQISLVLLAVFAIPSVRRLERRRPFALPFSLLAVATIVGLRVVEFGDSYNAIFRPHTAFLFVVFGWCAQKAATTAHRCAITAVLAAATPLYFDRWQQVLMVAALIGLLTWVPSVPVPRWLVPTVGIVAAASMWIFLVHWQVWPVFTSVLVREVAMVLTVATGVATWWGVTRASAWWRQLLHSVRPVAS